MSLALSIGMGGRAQAVISIVHSVYSRDSFLAPVFYLRKLTLLCVLAYFCNYRPRFLHKLVLLEGKLKKNKTMRPKCKGPEAFVENLGTPFAKYVGFSCQ